jgi:CRISPR-associated protein Cmr6
MPKPPRHPSEKKGPPQKQPENPPLVMAAPSYLRLDGVHLSEVPPGHRFRLYWKGWEQGTWTLPKDKSPVVQSVTSLGNSVRNLLGALRERQLCAAARQPHPVTVFVFKNRAPFVTGMGIEHPLENGFAFLDPYGLPYLPGSSVKGVLRRAAEELALLDPSSGWTLDAVWWLFGFDASSSFLTGADNSDGQRWRQAYQAWCSRADADSIAKLIPVALPPDRQRLGPAEFLSALANDPKLRHAVHLRGSLCFGDVFPSPPGQTLRVDLLNPHYAHYYQKTEPPGDWGNPQPIFFLSVPENTEFRFVVQFQPLASLPERYRQQWHTLVEKAFLYAAEWLGFGAKTSQGYGRLDRQQSEEKLLLQKIEQLRTQRSPRVAGKTRKETGKN